MMRTENKVIRVRDVMKREFDVIDGRVTVMEALRTMKHVETKSLIVDKRHDDDEFGMVLISDIAREVLAKDRSPDDRGRGSGSYAPDPRKAACSAGQRPCTRQASFA